MKRFGKIAALFAVLALTSQAAYAKTVVAPIEGESTGVVENFEEATQVYENQFGISGGPVGMAKIDYWGGEEKEELDYAGVADDGTGNKVLHIQNDKNGYDIVVDFGSPVMGADGVYRLKFTYIAKSKTQIRVKLKNSDWNTANGSVKLSIGGDLSTDLPLTINAGGWAAAGWSKNAGVDSIAPGNSTVTTYEIEINPHNAEKDGKQTITYYLNGKKGDTYTVYPIINDKVTENIFTHIDGFEINVMSAGDQDPPPDVYFDDLSLCVEESSERSAYDTFNSAADLTQDVLWGNPISSLLYAYGRRNVDSGRAMEFIDASAIEGSGKAAGDKALFTQLVNNTEAVYRTNKTVTLEKGERYTASFEYYVEAGKPIVTFYLNMANNSETGSNFEYQSLMNSDIKASGKKALFVIDSRTIYMLQNYSCNVAVLDWNEKKFNRIDITIDTCDESADGKQTLSLYVNGVLKDKGTFYEAGKTEPITSMSQNGWKINAGVVDETTQNSKCYIDNIWFCKSSDNLRVSKDGIIVEDNVYTPGSKLEVKYERDSIYTQSADEDEALYVACYDEKGMLTDCKVYTVARGSRISKLMIDTPDCTKMRLYLWQNSLAPLTFIKELTAAE